MKPDLNVSMDSALLTNEGIAGVLLSQSTPDLSNLRVRTDQSTHVTLLYQQGVNTPGGCLKGPPCFVDPFAASRRRALPLSRQINGENRTPGSVSTSFASFANHMPFDGPLRASGKVGIVPWPSRKPR